MFLPLSNCFIVVNCPLFLTSNHLSNYFDPHLHLPHLNLCQRFNHYFHLSTLHKKTLLIWLQGPAKCSKTLFLISLSTWHLSWPPIILLLNLDFCHNWPFIMVWEKHQFFPTILCEAPRTMWNCCHEWTWGLYSCQSWFWRC